MTASVELCFYPCTLAGMAIIGGGLAGMVLARRGIFKRSLLGAVGAGVVAANLYPEDYDKYKKETCNTVCATIKETTGEEARLATRRIPKLLRQNVDYRLA